MKLAGLVVMVALGACGGHVSEQVGAETADAANAPTCVADAANGWKCTELGEQPGCPSGVAAGVTCNGENVYTTNPTQPAHLVTNSSCIACAGTTGTLWTCQTSGWEAEGAVKCGE